MSEFYQYQGLCLCPRGGQLPEGARAVSTPFAPLLYLVDRDPRTHGALRPIMGPEQLDAPEDWRCLLPRRGSGRVVCRQRSWRRRRLCVGGGVWVREWWSLAGECGVARRVLT